MKKEEGFPEDLPLLFLFIFFLILFLVIERGYTVVCSRNVSIFMCNE